MPPMCLSQIDMGIMLIMTNMMAEKKEMRGWKEEKGEMGNRREGRKRSRQRKGEREKRGGEEEQSWWWSRNNDGGKGDGKCPPLSLVCTSSF